LDVEKLPHLHSSSGTSISDPEKKDNVDAVGSDNTSIEGRGPGHEDEGGQVQSKECTTTFVETEPSLAPEVLEIVAISNASEIQLRSSSRNKKKITEDSSQKKTKKSRLTTTTGVVTRGKRSAPNEENSVQKQRKVDDL